MMKQDMGINLVSPRHFDAWNFMASLPCFLKCSATSSGVWSSYKTLCKAVLGRINEKDTSFMHEKYMAYLRSYRVIKLENIVNYRDTVYTYLPVYNYMTIQFQLLYILYNYAIFLNSMKFRSHFLSKEQHGIIFDISRIWWDILHEEWMFLDFVPGPDSIVYPGISHVDSCFKLLSSEMPLRCSCIDPVHLHPTCCHHHLRRLAGQAVQSPWLSKRSTEKPRWKDMQSMEKWRHLRWVSWSLFSLHSPNK